MLRGAPASRNRAAVEACLFRRTAGGQSHVRSGDGSLGLKRRRSMSGADRGGAFGNSRLAQSGGAGRARCGRCVDQIRPRRKRRCRELDPVLHPRAGTPPNPGWFAPTDGERPPVRVAANDDPKRASDAGPGRSKPGDPFPTADAAAIAALLEVYDITRSTNLEYAGRIYQNSDGTFSYTKGLTVSQGDPSIPNRNCCSSWSTPGPAPVGTNKVASYHTHTDNRGTSAEFSGTDVVFYTHTDKLPGYMAGTDENGVGKILRFTPGGDRQPRRRPGGGHNFSWDLHSESCVRSEPEAAR